MRNIQLLQLLQEEALRPFQTQGLLSLQTKILFLDDTIKHNEMLILDKESLLLELERYKGVAESHIAFMNTGSRQASNMITEDALLKLYPIYHLEDEQEMDKTELNLILKEEDLTTIDDEKVLLKYFETAYPVQQLKPMEESIDDVFTELQNAFKGVFDVNSFLPAEDDLRYEIIKTYIPESLGFMLRSVFKPVDEQMRNLIDNILCDFKYTIVFYQHNLTFMKRMLQQNKKWFQNVDYLVLSDLPEPPQNETIDPNHWLNYCRYIGDGKGRSKLLYYMQNRINILCVGSHAEVRHEFEHRSKNYVASLDGQLIYTRNMCIDVLVYFKPGEKRKRMHFPEAAQRLTDAHEKLGQWMSSIFDPEKVPRDYDIDDHNELRTEVDELKATLDQKKQLQAHNMEQLRRQMDAPFSVPDIPNFDNAREAEEARLNFINEQITKFRNEIEQLHQANRQLTEEADNIQAVVNYRTEMKTHATDILNFTKAIKEKEQQAEKNEKHLIELTETIEKLEQDIKNLKYRTMSTVLRADKNYADVDWSNWGAVVTTPPTLFQNFVDGIYVAPRDISIQFLREVHDDDEPLKFCGKREWYHTLKRVEIETYRLDARTKVLKHYNRRIGKRNNRNRQQINVEFMRFNGRMTHWLNTIAHRCFPNDNIEYRFQFFFEHETRTLDMITLHRNGSDFSIENATYVEQILTHWLVFAAFHQYSHAPFVFIDLSNVEKDVIDRIAPIIALIQQKSQMFINSSHMHHIRFAKLQIGVNVTGSSTSSTAENNTIQIITHIGEHHIVIPPTPTPPPDAPDAPERDERDGTSTPRSLKMGKNYRPEIIDRSARNRINEVSCNTEANIQQAFIKGRPIFENNSKQIC